MDEHTPKRRLVGPHPFRRANGGDEGGSEPQGAAQPKQPL